MMSGSWDCIRPRYATDSASHKIEADGSVVNCYFGSGCCVGRSTTRRSVQSHEVCKVTFRHVR